MTLVAQVSAIPVWVYMYTPDYLASKAPFQDPLSLCFYVPDPLQCPNKTIAAKELYSMAIGRFDIPGDPDFPRDLNPLYAKPKTPAQAETMRNYLTQIRQEVGTRLLDKVYASDTSPPNKVSTAFLQNSPFSP